MKNKAKVFVSVVVALAVAQLLVILISWVVSVLFPTLEVNSLLGGEGLRWLLSSYEKNTNTPLLFYLLLTCFAIGSLFSSGVAHRLLHITSCNRDERWGITLFLVIVFVAVVLCVVYALYPLSFLLSVNGTIYPGPYLPAALIALSMAIVLGSFLYITITVPFHSMASRLMRMMTIGLVTVVPLVIIYFQTMELICSILYVFHSA